MKFSSSRFSYPFKYFGVCLSMVFGQCSYNRSWNQTVSDIIQRGEFLGFTGYHLRVKLDGTHYSIWMANYPYAAGHSRDHNYRPSVKNLIKLKQTAEEKLGHSLP